MSYTKTWSQFETQSLAFGMLRKALFPKYLVRGDWGIIRVYRPTADHNHPDLLLTIHVRATDTAAQSGFYPSPDLVDNYVLAGGDMAWKIVSLVKPLL
jgi:hypothetical protein